MIRIDKSTNQISMDGIHLSEIAAQYGTPLYLYSEEQIKKNVNRLKTAMGRHFQKYHIQYPIKANSNPHLLRIFKEENLGADCSSPAETLIAERVGFPMERSTYTGNFESPEDLKSAADSGIRINLDDGDRLTDLLGIRKPSIISFRINPGIGRGGFEGVITGGTDAKFGIPYEKTREVYRQALEAGIKRFGIHMMTGSNNLEPLYFAEITQKLITIAGEALSGLDLKLEFINIGGGLGIPYAENEPELDIEHTFELISHIYFDGISKYSLGEPEIVVEPGRYLVGNAGILLSRVTHVKESYRSFIGLDAGMNCLLRPALYKAYHRVMIDGKQQTGSENYLITGRICENSDIHPGLRNLPKPEAGDLAVILDAGAYGYAMSSNYNNRPRPAEALISNGDPRLIRIAEKDTDIFKDVPDFDF